MLTTSQEMTSSWLTKCWRWCGAAFRHLLRPTWGWVVLGSLISVLVVLVFFPVERYVRMTGLAFQLGGLVTVAWGLRQTRQLFRQPTWLSQFPPFTPRHHILTPEPARVSVTSSVSAVLTKAAAPALSIEKRVAQLEDRYAEQAGFIREMQRQWGEEGRLQEQKFQAERRDRHADIAAVQQQLQEFAAGGLHLEKLGLVWIVVGMILATASQEIAQYVADTPLGPLTW